MNQVIVDTIMSTSVSVPMWELIVAFVAITLCMLFRFNQMGLVLSFLFTFHLGWVFCQQELLSRPEDSALENFVIVYLVCGGLVLLLTIVGMIWRPAESD